MSDHGTQREGYGRRGLWLRLAAMAALLAILYSRVDASALLAALSGVSVLAWIAGLALYLVAQATSAYRWSLLTAAAGFSRSFADHLRLYFAGMFFSLCLPTSIGGDVYKAYQLADQNSQRVLAAGSVLLDRAIGLSALAVVALWGLAFRQFGFLSFASTLMALGLTAAAMLLLRSAIRVFDRLDRLAIASAAAAPLLAKVRTYAASPRALMAAFGLSLAIQALNVVVVLVLARSMSIELPSSVFFVAVPCVAVVTVLPVSISGVGLREGGLAAVLGAYGLATELGVGLGIAWFAIVMLAGLVGGAVYLTARRERAPLADQPIAAQPNLDILPLRGVKERTMSLSIVVPVYNEAPNLERLHAAIGATLARIELPAEIVLVDDGSTDGSREILRELAARDARVKVVYFRRNYGQTAAMNAGLHLATGDVIVTMDADLQNDPSDIPMMVAKLDEGYDLVHGWRKHRQDAFVNRKLPSKIANWLISRVTKFPVHDLGCTLKALRREFAHELQLYGEMHRFIPILAHWRGARCVEVVTQHHPRRFGVSKYGISRTVRVVLDLITVKYMIQYLTSPMKLFGGMGLSAIAVGLLAGLLTLGMKLGYGVDMTGNPLLLLAAFSSLAGLQFIVLGMLGELGARTYFESQQKQPYAIRELVNFDQPLLSPARREQIKAA